MHAPWHQLSVRLLAKQKIDQMKQFVFQVRNKQRQALQDRAQRISDAEQALQAHTERIANREQSLDSQTTHLVDKARALQAHTESIANRAQSLDSQTTHLADKEQPLQTRTQGIKDVITQGYEERILRIADEKLQFSLSIWQRKIKKRYMH